MHRTFGRCRIDLVVTGIRVPTGRRTPVNALAVVTGASSGTGSELAKVFADNELGRRGVHVDPDA